jgi:hypothetical protein
MKCGRCAGSDWWKVSCFSLTVLMSHGSLGADPAAAGTFLPGPLALAEAHAKSGDLMMAEVDSTNAKSASGPVADPSTGSVSVGSSSIGSHTISGGPFPPQPLNFPASVNRGPGWTVPQGPYRPLPAPPSTTTIKKSPE